jgi:hypothetical protein
MDRSEEYMEKLLLSPEEAAHALGVGRSRVYDLMADLSIDAAQRAVAAAGASEARLLPALASLARAMRWLHSVDPEGILAAEVLSVQRRSASLTRVSPAERFGQSALRAEDARRVGDP